MESKSIKEFASPWKTNAVYNYFRIPRTTPIPYECLIMGEEYIYKLTFNSNAYILKGYTLCLPPQDSPADTFQEYFSNILASQQEIYNMYHLAKQASAFSSHFCRQLAIDHKVYIDQDIAHPSLFYLEMIQEYGGVSLDKIAQSGRDFSIKEIFNYMIQSANAAVLLHSIGIAHLDLKPNCIVYDEASDTVKIIDFSISTSVNDSAAINDPVDLKEKVKGLTSVYAPPELLRWDPSLAIKVILGSIDVYYWGMTFYSLLCRKTTESLDRDAAYYRKEDEAHYQLFLERAKNELEQCKKAQKKNEK